MKPPSLMQRIMGSFHEYQWKTVMQSYALQSPQERKARLQTIMALSVELDGIRQKDRFATGLGEIAIEHVITGDWRAAKDDAGLLEFKDDEPELQDRIAPLWERFRDVLRSAVRDAELRENGVPGEN